MVNRKKTERVERRDRRKPKWRHLVLTLQLCSLHIFHVFTPSMAIHVICSYISRTELSTGRMDPRVGSGRVGSDRVGSGHDFARFWRVGSGHHFGFISFSLIISWYLNQYESSNTTFGLIDFHRRVRSDFLSAIAGRVGSGQRFAGRVGSKKSDPWTTLITHKYI